MHQMLFVALLILASLAQAQERVLICHGYGCLSQADILFGEGQLGEVRRTLITASDAADERKILGAVIGRLYGWAGEQSEIHNDRAGNYDDGYGPGRMDCIDHSTSTTRLLRLLEARGFLRWHRVLDPEVRHVALIFYTHYAAQIEEKAEGEALRFVVDSWFVNNGEPAVILPLDEWKKGAGPDV